MAFYQGTIIFNQGKLGWSETWYVAANEHIAALSAIVGIANGRMALLGSNAVIEGTRISDVAQTQDSLVSIIEGNQGRSPSRSDTPWNAIYCRFITGPLHRRQVWLRGIPDLWISLSENNVNMIPDDLRSAFTRFKNSLTRNGALMRVIDKNGAQGVPIDMTLLGESTDGYVNFTVPGVTTAVGKNFRVANTSGPDRQLLNGVHKVRAVVGNVVTSNIKVSDLEDLGDNIPGKWWYQNIAYEPVLDGIIMRPAKRSTGRAFFVPRGRRAVRR